MPDQQLPIGISAAPGVFELLTDETITSSLATADRKLIRELVPWTRVMAQTKTKFYEQTIDLPEFVLKHRQQLVLRPNDRLAEHQSFVGRDTDNATWDRAVRNALRSPYVVQAYVPSLREQFPIYQYGQLQMRQMDVAVHPHTFAGKMQGSSAVLQAPANGFNSPVAIAPVFLIEEA